MKNLNINKTKKLTLKLFVNRKKEEKKKKDDGWMDDKCKCRIGLKPIESA